MAGQTSDRDIDFQNLFIETAKLELKVLNAGMDICHVWINQAAKLSSIANDSLQEIEQDKLSLPEAVQRFSDFSKGNVVVFGELAGRLSQSYFEGISEIVATGSREGGKRSASQSTAKRRSTKPPSSKKKPASPKKPA